MLQTLDTTFFEQPSNPSSKKERRLLKQTERNTNKGSRPFVPRNDTQRELFEALNESTQIFAIGEAGTGKTYVPARYAARQLAANKIDRILIGRPTISRDEHKLGFLPGKLHQKMAPWLVPIMTALKHEFSPQQLDNLLRSESIEFLTFEHMRGRTFGDEREHVFVMLDEAQNCTFADLQLFLTRKGENAQFVITGDPVQSDLRPGQSGLEAILKMIEDYDLSPDIIEFSEHDVVRSEDAKEWVSAFKRLREKAEG